ncbi:Caspase domain containing protein [Lactarius tabidus]
MVVCPKVARFPGLRKPTTAVPPKYKALLIGINYTSPTGDNEQGRRPLTGPVNDAKGMKKVLIEVFRYKERDILLMTDEESNRDTARWPSQANILQALQDLVRDASTGDAFVFFYAGHSAQQSVTANRNEVDGIGEYILTCDYKKILDHSLRHYLVDPLPAGTRLTAILDSCHSGTLLGLDHYSCHWFLQRRAQSLQESKAPSDDDEAPRRHSNDESRLVHNRPFRTLFFGAVTAALAIVRLKLRLAKRLKVEAAGRGGTTLTAPVCVPRPRCGGSYCAYALLNGPLVISVSSCSNQQSAWEDSQSKLKSMTTKLIKILRKNPSVKVGDLEQQLKKYLSKMAFKRLREIKTMFMKYSAKLSPEKRKEWKEKFSNKGLFELKEQTAQHALFASG